MHYWRIRISYLRILSHTHIRRQIQAFAIKTVFRIRRHAVKPLILVGRRDAVLAVSVHLSLCMVGQVQDVLSDLVVVFQLVLLLAGGELVLWQPVLGALVAVLAGQRCAQ